MPHIHIKYFIPLVRLFIFILQKKYELCNKKDKEKKKEIEKKENTPYTKKEIKDRVVQNGVRVPSRKIPHTCTSWSDCTTYFLYWIWFSTLQNMQYKHAFFSSPTLSSTKNFIRNRKKRGNAKPCWWIIHMEWSERVIWGVIKLCFDLKTFQNFQVI